MSMRVRAILAVLATIVILATATTAGAQESEPDRSGPDAADLAGMTEEGTPVEAEYYASRFSIPIDEALKRIDRMDELEALLEPLAKAEADRLAGWGITHEPEFGAWILLTGDHPARSETIRLVDGEIDVQLEYGAEFTRAELVELVSRLEFSPELGAEVASTGLDLRTNQIIVEVAPPEQRTALVDSLHDLDEVERDLNSKFAPDKAPDLIRVEEGRRAVLNALQRPTTRTHGPRM